MVFKQTDVGRRTWPPALGTSQPLAGNVSCPVPWVGVPRAGLDAPQGWSPSAASSPELAPPAAGTGPGASGSTGPAPSGQEGSGGSGAESPSPPACLHEGTHPRGSGTVTLH